ncbi:MAG: hypothetical protein OXF73_10865, partial [Gammaproteobacteria bacterium]|nr:hypothetical protein [Gammaproteobacteria bacterium]
PRKLTALAAMLAAILMAPPVGAQTPTTGTINAVPGTGFTFTNGSAVPLNDNREWEVSYSVDLNSAINQAITNCALQKAIHPSIDCTIESPYTMRYGELDRSTCFMLSGSSGGVPSYSQAAIRGINATIPLTSWQQTVRARPGRQYCMAVYVSDSDSWYHNVPLTAASFITPADPNPPAPPAWMPDPFNTGCGTETTLALVRQCFQCKGGGGSWSMSANTCGN